jgi:hypothetical protein
MTRQGLVLDSSAGGTSLPAATNRALARMVAAAYLVALAVQDLGPTQRAFGRLGSNLALFILPVLVFVHLPEIRAAFQSPRLQRLVRGCSLFAYVTAIVSMVLLMFLPSSARGELLVLKAAKELALVLLWVASIIAGFVVIRHHRDVARKVLWLTLATCLVLLAYELVSPGNFFAVEGLFHSGPNIQMRPRLLTLESSTAGTLLAGLALGLVLVDDRPRYRTAAVVLGTVGVVLVDSKGAVATWSMALAGGYLISLVRGSWRRSLLAPVVAITLVVGGAFAAARVGSFVVRSIREDQQQDTSSATRAVYLLSAGLALRDRPLGGGFGGNIVLAERWLSDARQELASSFRGGAFQEVDSMLADDTDRAFSPKSLPVALIYYGGIGGLLLFGLLTVDLARASLRAAVASRWAPVVALFVGLATLSYVTSLYEYEIPLLIGALLASEAGS